MWRINRSKLTLQQVLIMAYMNVLEGTQPIEPRDGSHSNLLQASGNWRSANPNHELLRLEEDHVKPSRAWDRLAHVLALLFSFADRLRVRPVDGRTFPSASNLTS